MLVDKLEERAEEYEIRALKKTSFWLDKEGPSLYIDGSFMPIRIEALDQLLNILKIPIKYISRCAAKSTDLAITNINHWLEDKCVSVIINNGLITEVIDGERNYLASVRVNDVVIESLDDPELQDWDIEDDIFHAFYLSGSQTVSGYKLGVRVLYSDCFRIPPRIDGILYVDGTILALSVRGRNFRSVGMSHEQMLDQVQDFVETAIDQAKEFIVPALNCNELVDCVDYIFRMQETLRFSLDIRNYICTGLQIAADSKEQLLDFTLTLNKFVNNNPNLEYKMSREIQNAATNYLIERSFK